MTYTIQKAIDDLEEWMNAIYAPRHHHRNLETIRKDLQRCHKAQDWQPIETAPYNTDVLAFDAKTKTMHVSCESQCGWYDPDDHFYSEVGNCFKPTYWQPIPTPPTEEMDYE